MSDIEEDDFIELTNNPLLFLIKEVEWKSLFIYLLFLFHFVWLTIVIFSLYTRKFRIPIALISAFLSFFSEKMNIFMFHNYEKFGLKVNFFDKSGLFSFIFMALPMAFYLLVFVLSYFIELFNTLKKNAQIRAKIKEKRKLQNKKDS